MPHADPANPSAPAPLPAGRETTQDLSRVVDAMVLAMATLAEPGEPGKHILRIQHYCRALATRLKTSAAYGRPLSEQSIALLVRAAPLHDIGNSVVPDRILLKPSELDPEELRVMRTHTTQGVALIDQIKAHAGLSTQLLEMARDIIGAHHERWDGQGYPRGLSGEAIPMSARIMALADAYDALTSNRVYRAGVPHDRAIQLLFQERASQFDPDMVDALIEIQDEFAGIAAHYPDSERDLQKQIDYMAVAIAEPP